MDVLEVRKRQILAQELVMGLELGVFDPFEVVEPEVMELELVVPA
jgi:hypothetical protein